MRNVLLASFHNRRALHGLEGITIRQKFGNHTVASLDYRIGSKREYLLPPENTPVAVRWGSAPKNLQTFYGYVNHYETVASDQTSSRMVLVGTSKDLGGVVPSTWMDTTRSSIVRDIASRHRLASVVSDHPYVIRNWATGPRTDWKSLQALAQETGYHLWVDGSTLWFVDPQAAVRTAASQTIPKIRRSDIQDLEVLGGSWIPEEMEQTSRRVQYGLDHRTNEFFKATSGDPKYPTAVIPTTAVTYSDAQSSADAAERNQNAQYVLKGTIAGRADVHPGSLIQVESGRVNTDQEGLWLVTAATHEITNSSFTTRIVATRGADMSLPLRVRSTVRGSAGNTPAVIRDGVKWEAAVQEHVHV